MKTMSTVSLALLLVVLVFAVLISAQGRKPSTPEERQKAVQIAESLETDPLGKDAKTRRVVLLKWIDDIPDITIRYCVPIVGDATKFKGDDGKILLAQLVFSAAKFIILNPSKAEDDEAVNRAGLEGVLRTYQSIKTLKPKTKIEPLDQLLKAKEDGTLDDHVKISMTDCKR